jgi:signal transduction histidine kinase
MRNPPAWLAGAWGSLEVPAGSLHDSRAAASQAPRAMTMREQIASIAHEVKQPLAAIVANADACLNWLGTDQPDLARARKAAKRIVREGYRASAVLSSIRALLESPVPAMSAHRIAGVEMDF